MNNDVAFLLASRLIKGVRSIVINMKAPARKLSANDKQRHIFVETVGEGGGVIRFSQGVNNVNVYTVQVPRTREQKGRDDKFPDLASITQGSGFREGIYKQVFLIWKMRQRRSYYRALTWEECVWANRNVSSRAPGAAITASTDILAEQISRSMIPS